MARRCKWTPKMPRINWTTLLLLCMIIILFELIIMICENENEQEESILEIDSTNSAPSMHCSAHNFSYNTQNNNPYSKIRIIVLFTEHRQHSRSRIRNKEFERYEYNKFRKLHSPPESCMEGILFFY